MSAASFALKRLSNYPIALRNFALSAVSFATLSAESQIHENPNQHFYTSADIYRIELDPKAKNNKILQNFELKAQVLLEHMESEDFRSREQASRQFKILLDGTINRIYPLPAESLARFALKDLNSKQLQPAKLNPESAYRIQDINQDFNLNRPATCRLVFDRTDFAYVNWLTEIVSGTEVCHSEKATNKKLDLKAGIQYSFAQVIASYCRAYSCLARYQQGSEKKIVLDDFKKLYPDCSATYIATEYGLFTFIRQRDGSYLIDFLRDPLVDSLAINQMEFGKKNSFRIADKSVFAENSENIPSGIREYLPKQTIDYALNVEGLSFKLWLAEKSAQQIVDLSRSREFKFSNNVSTIQQNAGPDGSNIIITTNIFYNLDSADTGSQLDAVACLLASRNKYCFFDKEGRPLEYIQTHSLVAANSRRLVQAFEVKGEASKVVVYGKEEVTSYLLSFKLNQEGPKLLNNQKTDYGFEHMLKILVAPPEVRFGIGVR